MTRVCASPLPATLPSSGGAELCPLCGGPNECQSRTGAAYKGPCWCASVNIPERLLACVPTELRNRACICHDCVMASLGERALRSSPPLLPDDFYFDHGLMVFTAAYLLRRGYCCENKCRHCPYRKDEA